MHQENELGIAAHWAYQQVKSSAEKNKKWTGVKDKSRNALDGTIEQLAETRQ